MSKRFGFVILAVLIALIVFGVFFYFARDKDSKSISDNKSQQDLDGKNNLETNSPEINEIKDNDDSNEFSDSDKNEGADGDGGEGGGAGSTVDSVDNPIISPSYNGNDCGVSEEINLNGQLNLSTELNEGQRIVLDCMSSAISHCSQARMTLVSDAGDLTRYEIELKSEKCVVSKPGKSCSFSQDAINSLIQQALNEYPLLNAAKSYEVLSFVYTGVEEVQLLNGTMENVICE